MVGFRRLDLLVFGVGVVKPNPGGPHACGSRVCSAEPKRREVCVPSDPGSPGEIGVRIPWLQATDSEPRGVIAVLFVT